MNALSFVVLASVAACASAGLLGAPVQVATGTYSTYGARISQSAHPVSYAAPAYAAPAYAQAVQYAAPVAHAIHAPVAVPAATYSTSALRISQSARPVAYAAAPAFAAPAYAQAVQYASPVHHAIAHPAVGVAAVGAVPHAIGYGYTPALSTLLG